MLDHTLFTNVGERDNNEDYVGMVEQNGRYCFVLCDGLGGHGKGEVASQLVVESIKDSYCRTAGVTGWISDAVRRAQRDLLDKQREMNEMDGMKTTLVVLEITESTAQYTHVGDSRGYFFLKDRYKFHTLDHSVPQMLVKSHKIKERDIRNHPDRNRLLRVCGVEWDEDKFEVGKLIKLKKGKRQAFLLCSDGFWELITEQDMEECLERANNSREWVAYMQELILQNGSGTNMDNYSAIAVIIG